MHIFFKYLKFVTLLVYLTYARSPPRHSNSRRTHDANFEIFLNQHPNLKQHHLINKKTQVHDTFADLSKLIN